MHVFVHGGQRAGWGMPMLQLRRRGATQYGARATEAKGGPECAVEGCCYSDCSVVLQSSAAGCGFTVVRADSTMHTQVLPLLVVMHRMRLLLAAYAVTNERQLEAPRRLMLLHHHSKIDRRVLDAQRLLSHMTPESADAF